MRKLTFKGGAHPPERKDRSRELPIERLDPAKRVAIPLNLHLGQPIRSLVKVGDVVRRGQKIGDGGDRITAPVHASIAGTVTKIEPWPLASNAEGTGIVGMGGAGFPTHVKLSPGKPISLAIANAAECEPCPTGNRELMQTIFRKATAPSPTGAAVGEGALGTKPDASL
jgi:Na+-translocating ferredoxin:NAD+ oxidoreductase subunit C